ncbi:MAG: Type 1 glutamine amidotransferase-like domain-containing protein [Candidatus Liptonbacteria bacterium]|nr:Type 1 glutamine amidotransferase-like domain-containing protein [Candidatus Liptonbacteria bacterium]
MKFLLTSGGITNKSIAKALFQLVGKKPRNTTLVFIPTAANVEKGDKGWVIDDLINLKKQNFKSIDIVDISALPRKLWEPRLRAADILLFSGGNTFHLMYWLKKSGLAKLLPDLLKTRVYAGISAGSVVTTKNLELSESKKLYYEDIKGIQDEKGLGFFSFYLRPHLNSSYFPKINRKFLEETAKKLKDPIYALDDQSALKIQNGKIEVISEGKWLKI